MRDYSNIPVLRWEDDPALHHAKAQILREEPLVLALPPDVDLAIDAAACGCEVDEASGMLYDCMPGPTLGELARRNGLDPLRELAEAAERSGTRVDVQAEERRIVFHD
jgi:hypothetical protein